MEGWRKFGRIFDGVVLLLTRWTYYFFQFMAVWSQEFIIAMTTIVFICVGKFDWIVFHLVCWICLFFRYEYKVMRNTELYLVASSVWLIASLSTWFLLRNAWTLWRSGWSPQLNAWAMFLSGWSVHRTTLTALCNAYLFFRND